jgi:hypothetical protein
MLPVTNKRQIDILTRYQNVNLYVFENLYDYNKLYAATI